MLKKKEKTESSLGPEVSGELDKIILGKRNIRRIEKKNWPTPTPFCDEHTSLQR
jgi:hypothetical protein